MKAAQPRPGVFVVTLSAHELSVLVAAARMALRLVEHDPDGATAGARDALRHTLDDLDAALARARAGEA